MKNVFSTALLLLTAAAVLADDSRLDDRINLNLRDAAATQVLKSFEQVLSVGVEIDPQISASVSLQLGNVSVRTTLNALCESIGCEWTLKDGTLRFTATPAAESPASSIAFQPLNLSLKAAGAADVFRSLAQILEADLLLDPAVNGTFSIELEQAGLEEILQGICDELGCVTELIVGNDGRTLKVSAKATR